MCDLKNNQGLLLARKLLSAQFFVTLTIAVCAILFISYTAFISVILGGVTVIIPTLLFVAIFFRITGALNARKIARNFYFAETIKLILSIILFALVFIFCKIMPLMFFITFIVVQMITWIMLLLVKSSF